MKPLKKRAPRRQFAVAGLVLCFAAVLLSSSLSASGSAGWNHTPNRLSVRKSAGGVQHSELQIRLASTRYAEFREGLAALANADESGALDAWRTALSNPDPQLQREAWNQYRAVQAELTRKQFVPQIARINAPAREVQRLAELNGLEVTIWATVNTQTIAAAPPYLIERLRAAGIDTAVIYDSAAEWQSARAKGDPLARSITPAYQLPAAVSQMRIAVVNLAQRTAASPGYTDWLGDREDIVMRDGSRIAYLDVFQSDGSVASINAHIAERYTRRGYQLSGFYTLGDFADIAPQLFPGKNFDAGRRAKNTAAGEIGVAASGKFHGYEDTLAEFKSLETSHQDLARYSRLGTSFEGREIFALKISKDVGIDDASKPDVLITGCHHAREWISVESPVYIANQLLSGYATDDAIKFLVDHLQIWIVPIVNPDGLAYTQSAPNGQVDPVRLWRKNRRPISIGTCSQSVGVDLNRNYGYQWRLRDDAACSDPCSAADRSCLNDDIGGSDDPRSEIYRGSQPESELEVKAIKSLVDDPNRHFRAQIDFHNYSQLILYPWGYAPFGTDDANTLSKLATRMSDALFDIDRVRYRAEQAVDLYSLTGSSIDYAYGVNRVPAPFVVEMRPDCCDFTVPESEIPLINRENWSGARSLLNWASGPPILEAVKAYTPGPDGGFSKLVYSARWSGSPDDPGKHRRLVVDTRFPGIDPGRLQVRLQFSRPMNTSLSPRATLGRDGRLDEVTLAAVAENEGWQRTVYADDTWVGETVVIEDSNLTSPWQLAVSATDTLSFMLDALPETMATYQAGISHWQNYEDSSGSGFDGGVDVQHSIGPGVRSDYPNVLIASPNGGERLTGGDTYTVVWTAPNAPGSSQTLSLSTDGGASFGPLAQNIPSDAQRYEIPIPRVATTRGRIRLLAVDPGSHNLLFAASQADFSIGLNVGSNVDISFVSSERVDLNWSDTSTDNPPNTASGGSRLTINLRITNRGNTAILNPFLRVAELSRNKLLTRDPKSRWAEGARQSIDAGTDNVLSPGETAEARLALGLVNFKKFFFSVELYGVPSNGTIIPASAVTIWTGKPKTR
ncbi:MAG: M14 family zinc carboxypeptidase [Blastocatellia bacterium]